MYPDKRGYFLNYGGKFVPETIMTAVRELEISYARLKKSKIFQSRLKYYLKEYAGRPTPLYFAENLSKQLGFKIYLKREDLAHTGAHKINNTLGQVLMAKMMGKKRIIAETGAGQHGLATAMIGALLQQQQQRHCLKYPAVFIWAKKICTGKASMCLECGF